jgi:hypothetical protein
VPEASNDVSKAEMIMDIKHYRGHARGLEGQSTKNPQLLLKVHEVNAHTPFHGQDTDNPQGQDGELIHNDRACV